MELERYAEFDIFPAPSSPSVAQHEKYSANQHSRQLVEITKTQRSAVLRTHGG
jgi:hypothetical protein